MVILVSGIGTAFQYKLIILNLARETIAWDDVSFNFDEHN